MTNAKTEPTPKRAATGKRVRDKKKIGSKSPRRDRAKKARGRVKGGGRRRRGMGRS